MKDLFYSIEFILLLIFGSYLLGQYIFKKTKIGLLNPLVIAVAIVIGYIKISGIDVAEFEEKSQFVSFLLGPSVVALGYVLYQQMEYLKGNMTSILTSVFVGSLTGIFSVIILAKMLGAD